MYYKNIAIFIPAPSNNPFIPRKFVRKLNKKPLILYSIDLAKNISRNSRVYVISDDEEIDLLARRNGVGSVLISVDDKFPRTFNDEKVVAKMCQLENETGEKFKFVIWMGPSSPLIKNRDILEALEYLNENDFDAVFSASKKPQRNWEYSNTYLPSFKEIYNKTKTDYLHWETGAFFMMKRDAINQTGYSGKIARPFFINEAHALEIYSFNDWWVAEKLFKRKQILFIVAGYPEIGMGHVYRSLILAQEFSDQEISFICTKGSYLAYTYIHNLGYNCLMEDDTKSLGSLILEVSPDIVINDILETDKEFIQTIKKKAITIINFEDEGSGALYADLVINALYSKSISPNMLSGHRYFCLRDEFYSIETNRFNEKAESILLSFGGTDFNNLTLRILKLLIKNNFHLNHLIRIVSGPGYKYSNELSEYLKLFTPVELKQIEWFKNGTKKISELMSHSDVAIVSAGRTVFELTHLNIPSIIIAANEKELSHTFGVEAGHGYLGLHSLLSDEKIFNEIYKIVYDDNYRSSIYKKLVKYDFLNGKNNIVEEIEKYL